MTAALKADQIIKELRKRNMLDRWSDLDIENARQMIAGVIGEGEQASFGALALQMTEEPEETWPKNYQDQFWAVYPRRICKGAAMKKLEMIRKLGKVPFQVILAAVEVYRHETRNTEMKFIPHPATWLNQGRWDDDPNGIGGSPGRPPNGRGEIKNGFLGRLR